jgi:AraC-like DNA-binding protein
MAFSGSTSANGMRAVLAAAREAGLVSASFDFDFGVDTSLEARVPAAVTKRFWAELERAAADPLFGVKTGERLAQGNVAPLSYLLRCSSTLESAWALIAPNLWLLFDSGDEAVTEHQGRWCSAGYRRLGLGDALIRQSEVCIISTFVLVCREAVGSLGDFEVHFQTPAPRWTRAFEARLNTRAVWRSSFNGIRVSEDVWRAPITTHDPALLELVTFTTSQLAAARPPRRTFCDRLDEWLGLQLGAGRAVSAQGAARALGISTRSLQRVLHSEQARFSDRVDQVRHALATRWLSEGHRASEISHRIGYRDPSQFSRAFRRWTGVTPSEFLKARR